MAIQRRCAGWQHDPRTPISSCRGARRLRRYSACIVHACAAPSAATTCTAEERGGRAARGCTRERQTQLIVVRRALTRGAREAVRAAGTPSYRRRAAQRGASDPRRAASGLDRSVTVRPMSGAPFATPHRQTRRTCGRGNRAHLERNLSTRRGGGLEPLFAALAEHRDVRRGVYAGDTA